VACFVYYKCEWRLLTTHFASCTPGNTLQPSSATWSGPTSWLTPAHALLLRGVHQCLLVAVITRVEDKTSWRMWPVPFGEMSTVAVIKHHFNMSLTRSPSLSPVSSKHDLGVLAELKQL
jgi:hypothetical protein